MNSCRPLVPEVDVVIEIPRWSFLKRGSTGHVDFISPLPCPFNYGSVPDYLGLARLACEVGDDAPQAEICASILSMLPHSLLTEATTPRWSKRATLTASTSPPHAS